MGIVALAAAAAIVAAASPVAIAATPPRQGRMVPPESRPYRRHLPPLQKTRPPPSQAEINKVIDEHLDSIKVCYQRAVARDNSLTNGGKIAVKLSIGISGRVKHVSIDGPVQFRSLLEPCIREAVSRWFFPQASEEYGTEFPFVFSKDDDLELPEGCSITVNTVPWSEVWVDGKDTTRHTPLVGWKLPCGKHKLGLKRPDMQIDHTETISVSPGKRLIQRYTLTTDD